MKKRERFFVGAGIILVTAIFALFFEGHRTTFSSDIATCEKNITDAENCFAKVIRNEATRKGLEAGFDALAEQYDRDQLFAGNCHQSTHELGDIAYTLFKAGREVPLSTKTSYCGFGFYHGFMEALLLDTNDLSEARRFCEYADEKLRKDFSGVPFACYHGIGHGVIAGSNPDAFPDTQSYLANGLKLCDTLGDQEEHQERCASGVFNALAIAYANPKYHVRSNPRDPYEICRAQKKRYAHEACYDQMNGFLIQTNPSFRDALQTILKTAESAYIETAVAGAASYEADIALRSNSPESSIRDCSELSENLGGVCAKAFGVGLIEFGKPGEEYKRAIDICLIAHVLQNSCIAGVISAVRDRLSPAAKGKTCAYIQERVGAEEGMKCLEALKKNL